MCIRDSHEMVHAANLTPEQLSELLRMFAADMAPKPDTINTMNAVSYTHLDVYKRQVCYHPAGCGAFWNPGGTKRDVCLPLPC